MQHVMHSMKCMGARPRRRASLWRFGMPLTLAVIGYGTESSFAHTLPQGSNAAGGAPLVPTSAPPPAVTAVGNVGGASAPAVNGGAMPPPTSAPRTAVSSPFPALF